jgi:hypothetical protein
MHTIKREILPFMKLYVCALALALSAPVMPLFPQVVPQITCDATVEPLRRAKALTAGAKRQTCANRLPDGFPHDPGLPTALSINL